MKYLIEIPQRNNGIYIIFNIIEWKAYVGLAQNMLNRTKDHYLAICKGLKGQDNKNLIEEKNKNFLHIAVNQYDEDIPSEDLQNLESIYIVLMRDVFKFGLYNIAKKGVTIEQIKSKGYIKNNYLNQIENIKEQLNVVLEKYDIQSLYKFSRDEREQSWDKISKKFSNSKKRFCLEEDNGDFSKSENFFDVMEAFGTFSISKDVLSSLGIHWDEKSIKDKDLDLSEVAIISNFGSHNGEIPYEILKKMDMDLKNSSDGCAYWALKNVDDITFMKKSKSKIKKEKGFPVYVLFKTTVSDNSGGEKKERYLESTMTEEEINKRDHQLRKQNKSDLMHSYLYKEEMPEEEMTEEEINKGKWISLPRGLTYVTIPVYSFCQGDGYKAVAFKIKKFYTCKEEFNFKEILSETGYNSFCQGTYFTKIEDINRLDCVDNSVDTECLIAELEYPYLVQISNTPNLEVYLRGVFETEKVEPRIVFQVTDPGKNGEIKRAFAFLEEYEGAKTNNSVYVWDIDNRVTLENVINDTEEELYKEIKENGYRGKYVLRNEVNGEKSYEVIDIDCDKIGQIKIHLDRECKTKQARALKNDLFKYYWFMDDISSKLYAFRYQKSVLNFGCKKDIRDTKKPLFVLDPEQ